MVFERRSALPFTAEKMSDKTADKNRKYFMFISPFFVLLAQIYMKNYNSYAI